MLCENLIEKTPNSPKNLKADNRPKFLKTGKKTGRINGPLCLMYLVNLAFAENQITFLLYGFFAKKPIG